MYLLIIGSIFEVVGWAFLAKGGMPETAIGAILVAAGILLWFVAAMREAK